MKAIVTFTAFGKELGKIEEEVADEAEAERFIETMRCVKMRVQAGDKVEESTPFSQMGAKKIVGGGYELRQTPEGYLYTEPDDAFPLDQK